MCAPVLCALRTCNLVSLPKVESHKSVSNNYTVKVRDSSPLLFCTSTCFRQAYKGITLNLQWHYGRVKPWDALILCDLTLWNSDCQEYQWGNSVCALMSHYLFLAIKHFPLDFSSLASNVHKKDKLPRRLFRHGVEHTLKKLLHFGGSWYWWYMQA